MRITLWSYLLLALCATSAVAQEKPDFSGQWILEDPSEVASDVDHQLVVRQTTRRESALGTRVDAPFITLEVGRQSKSGAGLETHAIGVIGGTVGGVDKSGRGSGANGQLSRSSHSTRWDDDKLVIAISNHSGPSPGSEAFVQHVEVWSLDAEGRLVIAATDRGSVAGSKTIVLTYRRR